MHVNVCFVIERKKYVKCCFEWTSRIQGPEDGSPVRKLVADTSDSFDDISALPSDKGAEIIAAYNVDILVDYGA